MLYPRITVDEVEELKKNASFSTGFHGLSVQHCIRCMSDQGVNRAHILDGRIEHVLPDRNASVLTEREPLLIKDEKTLYQHEL